jgi:hypothetical protein
MAPTHFVALNQNAERKSLVKVERKYSAQLESFKLNWKVSGSMEKS